MNEQPATEVEPLGEETPEAIGNRNRWGRVGLLLIAFSGVLFVAMLSAPLLPLPAWQRAALAGGCFVAVQITWWSGVAVAGPQLMKTMKGWFSRNKSE